MKDIYFVETRTRHTGTWVNFFVETTPSESTRDTVVSDIVSGQVTDVRRVICMEGGGLPKLGTGLWRDVTADIAAECIARLDMEGRDIPEWVADFAADHLGSRFRRRLESV